MKDLLIFIGGMIAGGAITFICLAKASKKALKKKIRRKNTETEWHEEAKDIMKGYGAETDKPYVISPEVYGSGENEMYGLRMYANGVLVYDYNDEIISDIDEVIGIKNLACAGEEEDSMLYIRDPNKNIDYEIEFVKEDWKGG